MAISSKITARSDSISFDGMVEEVIMSASTSTARSASRASTRV